MSPRVPGDTPLRQRVFTVVTRCPGLIAADYARHLCVSYKQAVRVLNLMAEAGILDKAEITDPDSTDIGKWGYFPPQK